MHIVGQTPWVDRHTPPVWWAWVPYRASTPQRKAPLPDVIPSRINGLGEVGRLDRSGKREVCD